MKTIKYLINSIEHAGFKVDSRESTWAESKWWITPKADTTQDDAALYERLKAIKANAGRPMVVTRQTLALDGFDGFFVSIPKNQRAAEMLEEGLDPTDLQ